MATAIPLEPATIAALDDMVTRGRFASRDEAIRTALHIVEDFDADALEPLTPGEIAGIERGLADMEAGRTIPIEEVAAELERRHAAGL